MGFLCFGKSSAPVKEPAAAEHPAIVGTASCRRVSLDPYAKQRHAALNASAAAGPPALKRESSGARGGGGGSVTVSASPAGGRAASAPERPSQDAGGKNDYIEVNPLRRVSLPMAGQATRPANHMRRGSMPTAILTMPTQAAAPA